MVIEASAAAAPPSLSVQAGYGASLVDPAPFGQALAAAAAAAPQAGAAAGSADAIQGAMKGILQALEGVNGEANALGKAADAAQANGASLTPGQMVMLAMRCQEFMFHCQLTSNIANRTSDGLQQLFQQQG